ncbi:MAG: hypothetical protein RMK61_09270 [Bacteroidota bacterium]|nr:hypothetical protein [Bacteroidota bacterium]MDW8138615.1 hypothetical protein [Bacteroidota bacterium]
MYFAPVRVGAVLLFLLLLCSRAGAQQPTLEVGLERSPTALSHRHIGWWQVRSGAWGAQVQSRWTAEQLFFSTGSGPRRSDWRARASFWRALSWGTLELGLESLHHAGLQNRLSGEQWLLWGRWARAVGPGEFALSPLWGWDRRAQQADIGPGLRITGDLRGRRWGSYELSGRLYGQVLQISPRRFVDGRVEGVIRGLFAPAELFLRGSWVRALREYYQPASFLNAGIAGLEVIESTGADTLWTDLRLLYPLGTGWVFRAGGRFERLDRTVRHRHVPAEVEVLDTGLRRISLEAEAALQAEGPWGRAGLEARLASQEEGRSLLNADRLTPGLARRQAGLLEQAGYWGRQTRIGAFYAWPDVFRLEGIARIARHDTPEGNDDDFDELLYVLTLQIQPWTRADFAWRLLAQALALHTVYLKAARSAENQWQRLLRLSPSWTWTPTEGQRLEAIAELRANYAVDDFTLPGSPRRGQSARELRAEGRGEHRLGVRWRLNWQLSYSRLLIGRLYWPDFAETPTDTVRTWELWPRLQATWPGPLEAELGLRLYERSQYFSESPARSFVRQWGLTAALQWRLSARGHLSVAGWLQWQDSGLRPFSPSPGRSRNRRQIPNLSAVFQWTL